MKTAADKIKWHPYPEERPTEADFYLLTIKGPGDSEPWIDDEYSYDSEDNGIFYEYGWERYDDVIAWAQYPAPYKGDGSPTDELWTPCSDELPEEGAKCFVTCDDGRTRFVKEDEFVDKDMLFETDLLGWGKIVAWMPFPEPYKGRV